jgi:signal transduction histidine kinase
VERADHSKDEERVRIAREMHDGLSQTLAALRFRIQTWPVLLHNEPAQLEPEFSDVGTVLDEAQKELRGVIFALRPALLEEQGLQSAVTLLAENLGRHYQVKVHPVVPDGKRIIATDLEHSLFRMIQELLHNAARHAQANNIWLNLFIRADHIDLEVRDDGLGFDPMAQDLRVQASHWGLVHLRERVALLKGTISIESHPGQGTTVRITLPVEGADERGQNQL